MKVKIGNFTILEASVERFIDLETGLPRLLIKVSMDLDIKISTLVGSVVNKSAFSFECETLKTFVRLIQYSANKEKQTLVLEELNVSSIYKSLQIEHKQKGTKLLYLLPNNIRSGIPSEILNDFPFIRFILRKDIPSFWYEQNI